MALAKEKGFEFTQEEHDEFITEIAASISKLSDDQLDEVAGGGMFDDISGYQKLKSIVKNVDGQAAGRL